MPGISLQISLHRNFPTYLPNYFGHLKSIFSCKYHYLSVICKFCNKNLLFSPGFKYMYNIPYRNTSLYPLEHCSTWNISTKKSRYEFGKFADPNRKWKIPVFIPNYFRWQKGVQDKYLYMVVKINRSIDWKETSIWPDTKLRPITVLNSVHKRKLFIAQKWNKIQGLQDKTGYTVKKEMKCSGESEIQLKKFVIIHENRKSMN